MLQIFGIKSENQCSRTRAIFFIIPNLLLLWQTRLAHITQLQQDGTFRNSDIQYLQWGLSSFSKLILPAWQWSRGTVLRKKESCSRRCVPDPWCQISTSCLGSHGETGDTETVALVRCSETSGTICLEQLCMILGFFPSLMHFGWRYLINKNINGIIFESVLTLSIAAPI